MMMMSGPLLLLSLMHHILVLLSKDHIMVAVLFSSQSPSVVLCFSDSFAGFSPSLCTLGKEVPSFH